jgi:hypothetical protein
MSWRGLFWLTVIGLCLGFWSGLFFVFAGRMGV